MTKLGCAALAEHWAPHTILGWYEDAQVRAEVGYHIRAYQSQLRALQLTMTRGAKPRRAAQDAVLRSFSGRLCSLINAVAMKAQKMPLAKAMAIAGELWPWTDCNEPVRVVRSPKPGGGYRTTFSFGIRRGALSYLCRDILQIALGAPHDEFNRRGRGTGRAIKALRQTIETSCLDWVGVADIKNCFPSFRHEGIQAYLPLPAKVIRNVILLPENVVLLDSLGQMVSGTDRDTLRRGLPQGTPASPLVASYLLSKAFEPFGADEFVIRYSDNVACPRCSKDEAVATLTSLKVHLADHPVGELTLHHLDVRQSDAGVSFLGYRIVSDPDADHFETIAFPNVQSFERHWASLSSEAATLAAEARADFAIEKTLAWIASWTEWKPSTERIDKVLHQALAMVS